MNSIALIFAVAGLLSVMTAWAMYLATIPRGTVPDRPVGYLAAQVAGIALAAAGIAWSARSGAAGPAVIAPAAFAMFMAGFFLFLFSQRKTPVGDIRVTVGDSLLPFSVNDSEGQRFDSGSLAGKRVLLKFFRGGW